VVEVLLVLCLLMLVAGDKSRLGIEVLYVDVPPSRVLWIRLFRSSRSSWAPSGVASVGARGDGAALSRFCPFRAGM
jgi:hypothetical protein